ncbi:hypothetical protein METBIDRAFT_179508 [Metschnikowia bicuspidata var. bicuspidata NRRL YB-4993]|uniref:Uncharacterized protein n=1 Tax=Metschnikowia bicuspidata var. bicuspidata NRRL YB-4993 TaxID=869754 RepID=A0A1A0HBN3_9ASCO|nr:hypothetical protein METBIDRAFT_179508 [Metschnikowia bicuspidata var. bicuspidata NRRL YB-4993]OBA21287.1 hypothetical protein METBIDRAFT_179508 [Metschnikowia bicuspidata var. bicuspidata NRRL YB-4993]
MATKPDIATNFASQNLLSENKKKYGDLKRQQKTISSLPRTLRVNRRNKYSVVNQNSTSAKYKTGFVPVKSPGSKLLSFSAPVLLSSPKRVRRRRRQASRQSSLSERTFRKDPNGTRSKIRAIPIAVGGALIKKSTCSLRKVMAEKIQKTTEVWLPSLKMSNLTHWERPFSRPLNAIEQVLNDEIVEPTSSYLCGFRQFLNCKLESTFAGKSPTNSRSIQNAETPQTLGEVVVEGTNQGQPRGPTHKIDHQEETDGDKKRGRSKFRRLAQVGTYAKLFVQKLKIKSLIGRGGSDDNFAEIDVPNIPSPSSDTLKALRRSKAPMVLLSACLSFLFGLPIRPYPPAKRGPQMIMTPILTSTYNNLLLSPGKEIYLADTADSTDLRSERMKQILRVRFSMNNGQVVGDGRTVYRKPSHGLADLTSGGIPLTPMSCILEQDPDFESFMLPLDSGYTLQSPGSNEVDHGYIPKSSGTFSEFGYQVA